MRLAFTAACVTMLTKSAKGTVIMVALPTMRHAPCLNETWLPWRINAYIIVSASASMQAASCATAQVLATACPA